MAQEQELTELTALQLAVQRVENRLSMTQYAMAIIPMILIMVCSSCIMYYAYAARGNQDAEKESPLLSTILSIAMFIIELLIIAYRHHERYEIVRGIAEIMVRINLIHLIICGSCISYIKTGGEYNTYFILVCVLTVPIYLLSFSPFLCSIIHS